MKAVIEIPEGSTDKIEIKDGKAVVDRKLDQPVPVSYGFIPGTTAEDGDALDIFVISNKMLNTFDEVEVTIVGMFKCTDQGIQDNKLLAVISGEKTNGLLIVHMSKIGNYLMNYKEGFEVQEYKEFKNKKEVSKYIEEYTV